MKLRTKFLSLIVLLVAVGGLFMYGAVRQLAEELVGDLMVRYGQLVSKYDTEKTLAPLFKEINISREMANDPDLLAWAADPDNPALYTKAKIILEKYRWRFSSKSYSVMLVADNGYYHNDEQNQYADNPLQYTLDPNSPDDRWFFRLIEHNKKLDININPDLHLGVTKIWINVQMEQDGKLLGKLGTGLDYNALLGDLYANSEQMQGVSTIIIDQNQLVKFHRKNGVSMKEISEDKYLLSKRLPELIEVPDDLSAIHQSMVKVSNTEGHQALFINFEGIKQLAIVSHIAELDWYEITFIDMKTVLPDSIFISLYLLFCGVLLVFVAAISLMLTRWVIKPLSQFEVSTDKLAQSGGSRVEISFPDKPQDEIGVLMGHFELMAQKIHHATEHLELKVAERTEALDKLVNVDVLTELLNRRGMETQLSSELSRAKRDNINFGILWIDVDDFKGVNDSLGHSKGDQALKLIAQTISSGLRDYDTACRWGGDEFLVLLRSPCDDALYYLAERFRARINDLVVQSDDGALSYMLSVSVGAAVVTPDMTIKQVLTRADEALYRAKSDGRNSVMLWDYEAS